MDWAYYTVQGQHIRARLLGNNVVVYWFKQQYQEVMSWAAFAALNPV